jgi:hypothetical protein
MTRFLVTLRSPAEMLCIIEADTKEEALRLAIDGEGDPWTDWEPVDYSNLRVGPARETQVSLADDN